MTSIFKCTLNFKNNPDDVNTDSISYNITICNYADTELNDILTLIQNNIKALFKNPISIITNNTYTVNNTINPQFNTPEYNCQAILSTHSFSNIFNDIILTDVNSIKNEYIKYRSIQAYDYPYFKNMSFMIIVKNSIETEVSNNV